jgi:short-subunit dehydrogenase
MALAVVTGGSRGLGLETAKALKARGDKVVLVAKDPERLAKVAANLGCEFRAVNLGDLDAARIALIKSLPPLVFRIFWYWLMA